MNGILHIELKWDNKFICNAINVYLRQFCSCSHVQPSVHTQGCFNCLGLFIPQFCSFEKFIIFFRIYTKKEFPIFFCHHSAKIRQFEKNKLIAFQNHILEIKQNGWFP
jgi:hypothetical protein